MVVYDIDDDIRDADWTKRTWDLPDINSVESLLEWLRGQNMTVEEFKKLPIYGWNVDKLPWLRDLGGGTSRASEPNGTLPKDEGGRNVLEQRASADSRRVVEFQFKFDPHLHPKGPDGKFISTGKSGGHSATKVTSVSRVEDTPTLTPDTWTKVDEDVAIFGHETYGAARKISDRLIAQASKSAEIATPALIRAAAAEGGRMYGLEFRLKSTESMTRKIATRSRDQGVSLERAAEMDAMDAMRYTMHFPHGRLVPSAKRALNRMKAAGFRVESVENFYVEGNAYKGIHATMIHPDGTYFELQLHSPRSQRIKDRTHAMYEEARHPKTSPEERNKLVERMKDLSSSLPHPPGSAEFGTQIRRK